MPTYSRADWGARTANGGPGRLDAADVAGICLHWPAMSRPLSGFADVSRALRGWQAYHMDGHGWSDIAYQVAVDQDGNRYELRGLTTQPGANGDGDTNRRFGAMLLVLAPGERPSAAMLREAQSVVSDFRQLYPSAHRIVGHGQIRPEPTACPGPVVSALIAEDAFEPARKSTRGPEVDRAFKNLRAAKRAAKGGARRARLAAIIADVKALPTWIKRG